MKSGYLEDDNGNRSEMRLMCLISLTAAIAFGGMTLILKDVGPNGLYITFAFLLGAFCPKYLQKFIESKNIK